jgi:MinD superfamily P-loop ATPase
VAAVINRSDLGDSRVRRFCMQRGLPVLAEIPYSPTLAQAYANAELDGITRALAQVPARVLEQATRRPARRVS